MGRVQPRPPGVTPPVGRLLTAVAQEERTGEVLMVAHMDEAALARTREEGVAVYYSRSRQTLWRKGDTSGQRQRVRGLHLDCDGDAVLLTVRQEGGGSCHTGAPTCFSAPGEGVRGPVLARLERRVAERLSLAPEGSYTARLAAAGAARIAQKVIEEAGELALAAALGDRPRVLEEAADLVYHVTVLLAQGGLSWGEVAEVLAAREGEGGGG